MRHAIRPDAQAFDEIRLVTVPRYKTSGLSGDEWRIHVAIQFYRKGKMVHEVGMRDMEVATASLGYHYLNAIDDGKAYFAGEGDACDQEGCSETATVFYRKKAEYSREGHKSDPYEYDKNPLIRQFCQRHSKRGDCGLDDSDANYELLDGKPQDQRQVDVKPSIFGGIIGNPLNVEYIEAVKQVVAERDALKDKNERQRQRIVYLEGATNHATGTPLSKALADNERLRGELAEARKDTERMIHVTMGGRPLVTFAEIKRIGKVAAIRAAIDAAKEQQ